MLRNRNQRNLLMVFFCLCVLLSSQLMLASFSGSQSIDSVHQQIHEPSLVLLLVDEKFSVVEEIDLRIDRYARDVEQTLDVDTQQIIINDSFSSVDIRTLLMDAFVQHHLIGVVLIGNITTPMYESYPSLYPYTDIDDDYGSDIWIGVIRPPVGGSIGESLLVDYFDRNHAFHKGLVMFNKACLMASTYESADVLQQRGTRSGRWDEIRVVGNNSNDQQWKQAYLENLTRSAEVIHFHGHGSTKHHLPDIWYNDIINNPPHAAVMYLQSCTTGKFTEKNSIGGWYLFSGELLSVISFSSPVWGFQGSGWGAGDNSMHLLSIAGGSCVGQSVLASHLLQETLVILGDPTIRLPRQRPSSDQGFSGDVGPLVLERKNSSVEESWYRDHLRSADFNDDGYLDLLAETSLYMGNDINSYHPFREMTSNLSGLRPAVVDFDGDGDTDIISAGDQIQIFLNDGSAHFTLGHTIDFRRTEAVVSADFTSDGLIDIIASNESGSLFLYTQQNDQFNEKQLFSLFWRPYGMVSIDLDNDGDVDCVIGDKAGYLNILENNGYGAFTLKKKQFGGFDYHGLTSGDFNEDGFVDLFIKGTNCHYKILYNDNDASFVASESIVSFSEVFLCFGVTADDFDGDGREDILYTTYDGVHFKKNEDGFSNQAPNQVTITGPDKGQSQKIYEYLVSANDVDHDKLYYFIDWGDGGSDWIGFIDSDQLVHINHSWHQRGTYQIQVTAVDEHYGVSETVSMTVSMPKSRSIFSEILSFIERFFLFF